MLASYSTTNERAKGRKSEKFTTRVKADAMVISLTRFVESEMQRGSSTKNRRTVGRNAPFFLFFFVTKGFLS